MSLLQIVSQKWLGTKSAIRSEKKEENRALKVEYQQKYEDKNEIDMKCNTYTAYIDTNVLYIDYWNMTFLCTSCTHKHVLFATSPIMFVSCFLVFFLSQSLYSFSGLVEGIPRPCRTLTNYLRLCSIRDFEKKKNIDIITLALSKNKSTIDWRFHYCPFSIIYRLSAPYCSTGGGGRVVFDRE